jgi:hypothetical protein
LGRAWDSSTSGPLVFDSALAVARSVFKAALATTAHVVVPTIERLNALLHSRLSQLANVANARQVANAIAANVQHKGVAADVEEAHAPRDRD